MTQVVRIADKKTGKSVRIVTENFRLRESVLHEIRRDVLGVRKARELQARRGAILATRKEK